MGYQIKSAEGGDDMASIIEGIGKAFEEFKTKHDTELKEIKAGLKAAPTDYAKVETALTTLQEAKDALEARSAAEKKRIDELEKRFNRPGAMSTDAGKAELELKQFNLELKAQYAAQNRPVPAEMAEDDYRAYKSGFNRYLRRGDLALSAEEHKTMSVGSDPNGGYFVQANTTGRIVRRVYELDPIRQIASVQSISTDALEGVIDNDEAGGLVMVGETAAPATTATPGVGKWRIPVFEGYVEPKATQQLLEDAAVDVEAWLAGKVADKIARGQGAKWLNGNGVSEPRGLTTYDTVAVGDGARPWNKLEHVLTGANGDFAAANPADILFDVIGAFKANYLQNARWLTRREVITKIRKFKETTTGNYLWQPGLQQGQPQSILQYPVTIAQSMPTLAPGSLSLGFGDFQEGYQIVDRLGLSTIRDNLTAKPFVKFYTRVRFGGGVLNYEAIKFVKFSA